MTSQPVEISVEALRACGWQELLESSPSHECSRYSEVFFTAAQSDRGSQRAAALTLLGHATTMMLKSGAENTDQPLAPQAIMDGGRTAIPSDFTQAELTALREFAPEITDSELQARISDLVWITTRHFPSAQIAMSANLRAAGTLADEGKWSAAISRLERSLRLAATLGKRDGSNSKEVIDFIVHLLSRPEILDGKHNGLIDRLMRLLLEFDEGDPTPHLTLSNDLALKAEQAQDWLQAKGYWTLNALWHDRMGDATGTRSARLRAARSFEQAADQALSGTPPNHGIAVAYLNDALQEMRRLGEAAEAERLHAKLLEQQGLMAGQLVRFSSEAPDMSKHIQAARDAIEGKELHDAILELASMVPTMAEPEAASAAEDIARETPFLHSITSSAINEYGRTIAHRPSRYSDSAEEVAEAVHADAVDHAAGYFRRHFSVVGESARKQLLLEHHVTSEDLLFVLVGNPFVDRGRVMLIARGLQVGLLGDFASALHLLFPQLEHSLRHVLTQAGVITSGHDDPTGIQDEHNVNSLLYREELKSIFGENLVFSMRVALVERWGYNLRNRLAHGLLDESDCYSDAARYVWGLALHFYCLPALIERKDSLVATATSETLS